MTSNSRMKKMATSIGIDCIPLRLEKYAKAHPRRDGRLCHGKLARQPWLLGIVSAGLLLLPFSIIGPVPFWRTFFAWLAFVPLFYGLLSPQNLNHPKALLRGTSPPISWVSLVCRQLLLDLPDHVVLRRPAAAISAGILIAYSLVLGLYFAAFGLLLTATAKAFRGTHYALMAAPFFWVALELLSARFTKVPWDLLGYSQIDNFVLTRLAPFTGVYGLSFVLIAGNALIAWGLLASTRETPDPSWFVA
jgi:apolipoprotein N-acyltransferase